MTKPYVLHGWHLSYFSGKTRAYLRYKGIPFVDHEVDAYHLMWKIPRMTGATVMPVVVTPDGEWLQDTTHIVDVLEQRFPERPVVPDTPRQRVAAQWIEAWADEWWIPTAMHYRWSFPENYRLFEADAGAALLPGFPSFAKRRLAAYVAGKLRGYLPSVGVVPAQYAMMEAWTVSMLDALERHFSVHSYLLGERPTIADFALLGPMYGHLGRDPWPKRELLDPRPRLSEWVVRMNAAAPSSGALLENDAVPATLGPVFSSIFKEFVPMVAAIGDEVSKAVATLPAERSRLPRALGMIDFPMGGGRFRRAAMPYSLWMVQRVLDSHRGLDAAGRAAVDTWLMEQGGSEAKQLQIKPRLRRVGLHVAVER